MHKMKQIEETRPELKREPDVFGKRIVMMVLVINLLINCYYWHLVKQQFQEMNQEILKVEYQYYEIQKEETQYLEDSNALLQDILTLIDDD